MKQQYKRKGEIVLLQKPSAVIALGGHLTLIQRKFYNVMLKHVKEELKKDPNKMIFSIPLAQFQRFVSNNINDKHHFIYEESLKKMHKMEVVYNVLGKDNKLRGQLEAYLINEIGWEKNGTELIVKFSLPSFILEAIKNIINGNNNTLYANIDLMIIKGLKSKYSIVLYELCKDYEKAEVPVMTIKQLRTILDIQDKKSYQRFDNIKNKVLDPAIKELNTNPDVPFTISYTLIKEWRRYTHIKFHISPKKALPEDTTKSNIAVFLSAIPEKYHSDSLKKALEKAIKKYSTTYILAQIEYVNKHHPNGYVPYLQSALKSDFAQIKSREAELEAREKVENLIEKIKAFDIHNIPLEGEGNKTIYDVYVTKKSTVVISLLTENGVVVERYSLLSDADKAVKRLQELLKALKKSSKKQPA